MSQEYQLNRRFAGELAQPLCADTHHQQKMSCLIVTLDLGR
jgi:hypothetical protein